MNDISWYSEFSGIHCYKLEICSLTLEEYEEIEQLLFELKKKRRQLENESK